VTEAMMNQQELYKPLVLCVDDDEMILDLTRMALEREGFRVLTAACGLAALKAFASNPVDAVILDYEMPGMNGAQVALEMKRINPNIPKMLFSSSSTISPEDKKAVQGYCTKPTNLRTLTAHVKELTTFSKSA